MKPKLLLRIAAGCIAFFALGHTVGHFTWKNTTNPLQQQIIKQMNERKFEWGGSLKSIGENYTGYSSMLIVTLLALTVLVWIISNNTTSYPKFSSNLLIPILLVTACFGVLSYVFFFLVPAMTCLIATVLILLAIIKLSKTAS